MLKLDSHPTYFIVRHDPRIVKTYPMRALSIVVGTLVAGILVCFGMTIYTGIRDSREKARATAVTVPVPAGLSSGFGK